ncbi:MAG TPA: right-handed parallel beta-helix repeat-containing protein [Nocardioides sp.]|uniref:right-handed parallel beta-helix repeat-containing protein n=1 Tax=Nocardioides sp. TaxID=35761 RepID=UPI002E2EEBD1|nr:right-handed parallel beta-helix repeat-containing protein [Nocardioides sp.]HEX5089356.1 right-handed parallel beta-helix repeat-containing protein [Nocardioides sp.]
MSKKHSITTRLAVLAVVAGGASLALPSPAAEAAGATTYYVSPTGSDANNGTSPSTPIQTLGRASNLPLNPGDQVLLQRGASFSGKLAVWRSGTAGSPITIGAYGSGSKPVVTGDCLEVGGSYVTMTDLTVQYCTVNGIWTDGVGNVISNVEATHNVQGIDVGEHARNTKVVRNYLHHNDRMAPNTPGAFDDWGAVGMVVQGDDTEVAYNTITDNWAPSPDFGTDGSAVEIYGGVGTLVHHNTASNNRTFTELGNSRSANNTFAYNLVTSNLRDTEFLITRGSSDYFGPVTGTVAVNNSVKLTGANSLGFSCYAGCTDNLLMLYNNVLDVAGRIGYLDGSMSGGNNVYWRGSMGGLHLLPGDRYADPRFRGRQLVPTSRSPLVDTGRRSVMKKDLDGRRVGVDGNGDGKRGTDIGAYEVRPKRKRHHGAHHHPLAHHSDQTNPHPATWHGQVRGHGHGVRHREVARLD